MCILLVEDEPRLSEDLTYIFAELGYFRRNHDVR